MDKLYLMQHFIYMLKNKEINQLTFQGKKLFNLYSFIKIYHQNGELSNMQNILFNFGALNYSQHNNK